MKFFSRPSPAATDTASQRRVDAIIAAAKAQTPVAPARAIYRGTTTPALAFSEDILDVRLAEELAFARRTLEAMGDALCDDPILLSRHQVTLQSIDLLAQILGHVATVVGSADRDEAVARIGMVELRNRLTREERSIVEAGTGFHPSERNPFNAA